MKSVSHSFPPAPLLVLSLFFGVHPQDLHAQTPKPFPIPDTLIADRDVVYSSVGGRQTLDVIRPRAASGEARPAVLLIHGGGFRAGAKESYLPLAVKLAEHGYVAATAN